MKHRLSTAVCMIALFFLSALSMMMVTMRGYGAPTVWTDKAEYNAYETVTVFGNGFLAYAKVTISIKAPDLSVDTIYAWTDGAGAFTAKYVLDGVVGTFTVTATDGTNTAFTTFTDPVYHMYIDTYTTANPVELTGHFDATSASGHENQYGVGIDWDDLSPLTMWRYSDANNGDPYLTWNPNDPNAKDFSGTYDTNPGSAPDLGHNYASSGTYHITAKFFHAEYPGAENSKATASITITITIPQYYLTVNDGGHGTAGGQGWYNDGATAYATITPLTVSGGAGTQYVFAGWSVDATGSGSPSDGILMNAAKTATATWTTQYWVTYAANVPVTLPASEWVVSGQAATGTFTSPQYNLGGDTKYVYVTDNRPGSIIAPTTITATYDTYYNVHYAANVPVTVPADEWVISGGSATGVFPSPVISGGTKYVFVSDDRPDPIIAPTTITATYDTYYWVTYAANVPVTLPASEWVLSGHAATGVFPSPVISGGITYVFVSDNRPASITAPTTITATYQTGYWVTYAANVPVTLPADEWVLSGNAATGSFASPQYNLAGDTKYVFVSDDRPLTITAPTTITATYDTYYNVHYAANVPVTVPADEWVISGGSATGVFPSPVISGGTKYVFVSDDRPDPIIAPTTITATYDTYYWVTYAANVPVTLPASEWVLSGHAATGVFPSPVISGGTKYVFVSDDRPLTITAPTTITATYKTQYLVTFTQTGSAVAPTVTYTANTDPLVPCSVWVLGGSQISYTYQAIVSDGPGVQFVFTGVTPASPQTVNGPLTIVGSYKTQYYLRVLTYGDGLQTFPDNTVTPPSGWFDAGAHVTLTAAPKSGSYVFHYWSVDSDFYTPPDPGPNPIKITMNSPHTAIAWYADPPNMDFNGDGVIDLKDLVLMARCFGAHRGDPTYNRLYDLNGDGRIDLKDLAAVARAWQGQ